MDITLAIELAALFLLLGFSAFFSSSETSLFSLSATQMQQMRRDRNPRLRLIEEMLSEPRRLIATILIGNELVNVSASVLSAMIVIDVFGADKSWLNIIIMVPMLLLFGEITPKTLALANNVAFATVQSRYIDLFARFISPLRTVVRAVSEFFINLIVSEERSQSNILTEDMVRSLTHAAVGEGSLDAEELKYIHQIFDFGNKTVGDVMTYRSQLASVDVSMSLNEIIELQQQRRHSKFPVFDDKGETVIGVLFARDLLAIDLSKQDGNDSEALKKILRKPYLVPESRMAADLFITMREQHLSLALVTDEFGGIIGVVTLEDLLECIFGELPSGSDSSPVAASSLEVLGKGLYRASGNLSVTRFNAAADTALEATGVSTLAGLVLRACGEFPAKNDVVTIDNVTFTVVRVAKQRIAKLAIHVRQLESASQEETQVPDPQTKVTKDADTPAAEKSKLEDATNEATGTGGESAAPAPVAESKNPNQPAEK